MLKAESKPPRTRKQVDGLKFFNLDYLGFFNTRAHARDFPTILKNVGVIFLIAIVAARLLIARQNHCHRVAAIPFALQH